MIATISPSSISWTRRVSRRNAAIDDARKISSSPDADHERALEPCADEQIGVVVVDHDEGEVALELAVSGAHRLDQIALVVALDEVDDDLGVGLGAEAWPSSIEGLPSARG